MRSIVVIALLALLCACASYGTKVDQDKLTQFTKGKTRYDEVVHDLGQPNQTTINSDGTKTISYTYTQTQAKASNFIPFVGAFMGGADTENSQATLTFDKNGILTNYSATQGGSSMNTGLISGQRQQ